MHYDKWQQGLLQAQGIGCAQTQGVPFAQSICRIQEYIGENFHSWHRHGHRPVCLKYAHAHTDLLLCTSMLIDNYASERINYKCQLHSHDIRSTSFFSSNIRFMS